MIRFNVDTNKTKNIKHEECVWLNKRIGTKTEGLCCIGNSMKPRPKGSGVGYCIKCAIKRSATKKCECFK